MTTNQTLVPYTYKATPLRVVDGDTVDLRIDAGFRMTTEQRIRLLGIDCPEMHAATEWERAAAKRAKEFTTQWFAGGLGSFVVTTEKADDFGRYLGRITSADRCLNDDLVAAGLATEWPVRWHEKYPAPEAEQHPLMEA